MINFPWFISFLEFGDNLAVFYSVFVDSLLEHVVEFAGLFRLNQFQKCAHKNDCGSGKDATSPLVSLHYLVLEYAWKIDLEQDVCSAGSEQNQGVPNVMEEALKDIKVLVSYLSAVDLVEKLQEKEDVVDLGEALSLVSALLLGEQIFFVLSHCCNIILVGWENWAPLTWVAFRVNRVHVKTTGHEHHAQKH